MSTLKCSVVICAMLCLYYVNSSFWLPAGPSFDLLRHDGWCRVDWETRAGQTGEVSFCFLMHSDVWKKHFNLVWTGVEHSFIQVRKQFQMHWGEVSVAINALVEGWAGLHFSSCFMWKANWEKKKFCLLY